MFVLDALSVFLATVWITSGIDKVLHPEDGLALGRYLGWIGATRGAVRTVGTGELALGASWLVVPRIAGPVTVVFLVGYSALMAQVLRGGSEIRCACGGVLGSEQLSWRTLVRNGLLILAALFASVRSSLHTPALPIDWFGVVAAGTSMAIMLGVMSQLGEFLAEGTQYDQ
jgi:hypothetical protein